MDFRPIDYTSKDYMSFREDMLSGIAERMPEWTSRSPNDFGVVLIELFSYMGDVLSYYGDRIANESFLGTAVQRRSVLNIARTIGYEPTDTIASTVELTFSTSASAPGVVTVPKATKVSTRATAASDLVLFETDEELVIAPGTEGAVTATQGETVTDEILGTSNGRANQVFRVFATPVIEGSLKVYVDEGAGFVLWNDFAFLIEANETAAGYSEDTDANGTVYVRFGDNVSGRIPAPGATVRVTYRIGGGKRGNVPAQSIVQFYAAPPSGVTKVINAAPAVGGADAESMEDIRTNAPNALRALDRAVNEFDYEHLAITVAGVAKAKTEISVYTSPTVYIAPYGAGQPTPELLDKIDKFLEPRKMAGSTVTLLGPLYVTVHFPTVSGTYGITLRVREAYNRAVVRKAVEEALTERFSFSRVNFGERVSVASIYSVIMRVQGVEYVIVNTMSTNSSPGTTGAVDIVLNDRQIPTLGILTIGTTGGFEA